MPLPPEEAKARFDALRRVLADTPEPAPIAKAQVGREENHPTPSPPAPQKAVQGTVFEDWT
jgi:hypothetical protein